MTRLEFDDDSRASAHRLSEEGLADTINWYRKLA